MRLLATLMMVVFSHALFSMDTVRVENVDQFLKAIASDQLIMMSPGSYDLSSNSIVKNFTIEGKESVELTENLSYSINSGFTIKGVKNLRIIGTGNDPSDVSISSKASNNYLISFYGCTKIELVNLLAEHTEANIAEYESGILFFNQCSKITVSKLDLIRGKVGVRVSRCKEFTMKNTTISECTSGFVELIDSWTLRIGGCNFEDNVACNAFWYMTGCMDVLVENSTFENNEFKVSRNCRSSKLFSITRSEMVFFKNNTIRNNESRYLGNSEAVRLLQSSNEIKKNKFKDLQPSN